MTTEDSTHRIKRFHTNHTLLIGRGLDAHASRQLQLRLAAWDDPLPWQHNRLRLACKINRPRACCRRVITSCFRLVQHVVGSAVLGVAGAAPAQQIVGSASTSEAAATAAAGGIQTAPHGARGVATLLHKASAQADKLECQPLHTAQRATEALRTSQGSILVASLVRQQHNTERQSNTEHKGVYTKHACHTLPASYHTLMHTNDPKNHNAASIESGSPMSSDAPVWQCEQWPPLSRSVRSCSYPDAPIRGLLLLRPHSDCPMELFFLCCRQEIDMLVANKFFLGAVSFGLFWPLGSENARQRRLTAAAVAIQCPGARSSC